MNVADKLMSAIEAHPRIDFDNGPGLVSEYWSMCPCGYSTPRMKSRRLAEEAFNAHVAEELALMLAEDRIIPMEDAVRSRGKASRTLENV